MKCNLNILHHCYQTQFSFSYYVSLKVFRSLSTVC